MEMAMKDYFTGEMKDYTTSTLCRHQPTLIYELPPGVKIFGASQVKVDENTVSGMDLVINLTGKKLFTAKSRLVALPRAFKSLENDFVTVDEMVWNWTDYSDFPAGRSFWEKLYSLIQDSGRKRILFFCVGGHGRTGTAAACLKTVALDIHGGVAIREVRKAYCEKAIEAKIQENYVRGFTSKEAGKGCAKKK